MLPYASRGSHRGEGGSDKDLPQTASHMGLTQPRLECGAGWGWEEGHLQVRGLGILGETLQRMPDLLGNPTQHDD